MRYARTLFLIASCTATGISCMDSDQKTLILKEQFAKISWFQNADPKEIKVIGLPDTEVSKENATQLQQAFLTSLQAPFFEFPYKECTIPVVCLDLKRLVPLLEAVQQLKQTEEEKAEQLRKKEEQEKKDKLIAQLIQKHKEANEAYRTLEHAMTFFMGDNEYWNSDLPRQNELRLERLKQEAERARVELDRQDKTHKRFDQTFLKAWQLDA